MSAHNPHILIQTELGDIVVELYPQQAPITANNFLRYVAESRFADATFYRVVRADNQPNNKIKIDVIQGGLKADHHPQSLPPIPHENTQQTGLRHEDGMLSMARNDPAPRVLNSLFVWATNPNWISAANATQMAQASPPFEKCSQGSMWCKKFIKALRGNKHSNRVSQSAGSNW